MLTGGGTHPDSEMWPNLPTIRVVTWLWQDASKPALFGPEHVNKLHRGLKRHLHRRFDFTVITDHDDLADFDAGVQVYPMIYDHADMRAGNRSCFRRLRLLEAETSLRFGDRIAQLDLDAVIVGDVTPLFDRTEPLLMHNQGRPGSRAIWNPSVMLMDAGVLDGCWREFNAAPTETWQAAKRAGWSCSDMSVLNHWISRRPLVDDARPATWTAEEGMLAFWRDLPKQAQQRDLPVGARMVLFYGMQNPHDPAVMQRCPWIAEHWV